MCYGWHFFPNTVDAILGGRIFGISTTQSLYKHGNNLLLNLSDVDKLQQQLFTQRDHKTFIVWHREDHRCPILYELLLT